MLKSKTREGARVQKKYYAPMTPCDRLLALPNVTDATKAMLREQFNILDPISLLQAIREAQNQLARMSGPRPVAAVEELPPKADVVTFINSLSTAWKGGEVRATHRKQPGAPRSWKTRPDPFEHAWPMIEQWLQNEPSVTAKEPLARLSDSVPDVYSGTKHLRTLQRRVQKFRGEQARELILGSWELTKLRA